MTLPDQDGTRNWIGRTVVDRDGAEIGVCSAMLTDTSTGLPEWLSVDRDEATVIVPVLDARETGGRVHVTVTRAYADGAPRFGPTQELTRDQEAALYRHYGIEYSAATSDSLLPADAHRAGNPPAHVENGASAPDAPTSPPVAGGPGSARGVSAAVAVLLGVAAAVVAVVRLRRAAPPPRPAARQVVALPPAVRARAVQAAAAARPLLEASGRRARTGASAGAASLQRAAVDLAGRSRSASTAALAWSDATAARLAPLLDDALQAAWHAVRGGTDSLLRVTDAATEAVVASVPRIAGGAARAGRGGLRAVLTVGAAAEAVPEVVAETGERLEKGWEKVMGRLSLGLGFGVGYVLGARAGRARYEQIKEAAADFLQRPEVRSAVDRARTAAPAPLRGSIDKLTGSASGSSQGPGAGTIDQVDAVTPTPAPSVPGTDSPSGTDAGLPDPLIPPGKSGDGPTAGP